MDSAISTAGFVDQIADKGFAFVGADDFHSALEAAGPLTDWDQFAASWNDLELDAHMADGGRYRRRRYAVYAASRDGAIERAVHQPHFQARHYNALNGGIPRWFEPILYPIGAGPTMMTTLGLCRQLFGVLAPQTENWHIEVHQFRIEARADMPGMPTPEGMHRDGVDYVLVMLIGRSNIARGTTSIHALNGKELGSFTLSAPFDAALVEDARVFHGVTAVRAVDPGQPAFRDVLVVTFRKA
jgi:hypothetical protein